MIEDRLIRVPEWFASPIAKFPDVTAILRNPHRTVEDAEAYAATLSVPAQYGAHVEIANMVNEVLTQMKARNLSLFSAVFVHADYFKGFGEEAESVAARTDYNAMIKTVQCGFCTHYRVEAGAGVARHFQAAFLKIFWKVERIIGCRIRGIMAFVCS